MSAMTVDQILVQIETLNEEERTLLEERLLERAEAEWLQAATQARQIARRRGIGQTVIDQAVDAVRYQP